MLRFNFTFSWLICLSLWLIFSSFRPQTFVFFIEGTVQFKDAKRGSAEGIWIQVYGDGEMLSETKVDENQLFQLDFLDLHYEKIELFWREEGVSPFKIMRVKWSMFDNQAVYLYLKI